ncbi:MAG: tetratricopeptide repeat protein, partial [Fimbriimonadales bacterium]|nr:tetratricopeptide repeat protein [Fimbriimonadales bacterium]
MVLRDPVEDLAETLSKRAEVLYERGEVESARQLVEKFVGDHPGHPAAMELQADLLRLEGKWEEARDLYASIIKQFPGRINTERKHAQVVLRLNERELERLASLDALEWQEMRNPAGLQRHASTSAFLSLLMPGFGQAYNGQWGKAGVFAILAIGWGGGRESVGVWGLGRLSRLLSPRSATTT